MKCETKDWLCSCKDDPCWERFPPSLPARSELWQPGEHTNRQESENILILLRRLESGWGRTSTGSTGKSSRTTQRAISGDDMCKRNIFSSLSQFSRQLRVNEEHSDLSLACEDGQQFDVHKIVLSACSPFFQVAKMTHSQICCCTFFLVSDDAEAKPSPAPPDLHEGDEELGSCLHP